LQEVNITKLRGNISIIRIQSY